MSDTPITLEELDKRLHDAQARVMVVEVIYSTIAALILRSVNADLRDGIMRELRSSISVSTRGLIKPSDAELMTLQIEEHAQQLLDQIERMARLNPGGAAR